jgi:O-antigen ligase
MSLFDRTNEKGILLKPRAPAAAIVQPRVPVDQLLEDPESKGGAHTLAFAGLFLFTVLLYVRPNDLFPEELGDFSTVKFIAIPTILIYVISRLAAGKRLTDWPIEIKMVGVILVLCIAFIPFAASSADTIDRLSDPYLKVVAMFVLMVNLIDTKGRLRLLMQLMVVCATAIAIGAIADFVDARFSVEVNGVATRIEGNLGGIFENPNDLATSLDLVIPIAIGLGVGRRGIGRLFYFGCAGILAVGVITTFSRGGFLGLLAVGSFLLWKVSRRNRSIAVASALGALLVLLAAAPGGYGDRLFSIVDNNKDKTGSAQERTIILKRALLVSLRHPIIGVGMNNFHIYSYKERVAHNSFLEVAAELGVGGLIAYLILIFAPFRALKRIEARTSNFLAADHEREIHHLSLAVQGSLVAYIVCSTFTSIEYLWYLYYPVAFAVALQKLYPVNDGDELPRASWKQWPEAISRRIKGALWGRERPRLIRARANRGHGRLIGVKR